MQDDSYVDCLSYDQPTICRSVYLSVCRFSQESWSNLRKRLVQLHINFYATTFVVMLLVYSFPSW